MLQQILLTTIILPLAMGIVIAIMGKDGPFGRTVLVALLVPVAAAIASMAIEGMPAFPPVAAKHRLPMIFIAGGMIFFLLALTLRQTLPRIPAAGLAVLSLALPIWWLGRNVLAANSTKAGVVAAVALVALVSLIGLTASPEADRRRGPAAAVPAALLWVSIASALASIFGGYIGMAQLNGALAALTGGWLLVNYVRYLRGDDGAFALAGIPGLAFIWTLVMSLIMTALFAPSAAPAAIVLAVLPLAVALVLIARRRDFAGQPRFARPILSGIATAVPAVLAILIAAVLAKG